VLPTSRCWRHPIDIHATTGQSRSTTETRGCALPCRCVAVCSHTRRSPIAGSCRRAPSAAAHASRRTAGAAGIYQFMRRGALKLKSRLGSTKVKERCLQENVELGRVHADSADYCLLATSHNSRRHAFAAAVMGGRFGRARRRRTHTRRIRNGTAHSPKRAPRRTAQQTWVTGLPAHFEICSIRLTRSVEPRSAVDNNVPERFMHPQRSCHTDLPAPASRVRGIVTTPLRDWGIGQM